MLIRTALAVALLGGVTTLPAWAGQFVIARDGAPQCGVRAEGHSARAPAEELGRYLERIVGTTFPEQATGPQLIVRVEPALGEAVRVGTPEGPSLVIAGGSEQQTWYAVYAFLYRLGCRWFMPGEIGECVPSEPSLSVEPAAGPYTPSFPYRVLWYAWGDPDGDPQSIPRFQEWSRRNCLGASQGLAHGHNLLSPIPAKEYFENHPEYYALYQGERRATQPCTTNPEVIRLTIERLLDYFRSGPQAKSYSLCIEDNGDFCECPNCTALDPQYPGLAPGEKPPLTDRMLVFYNQVAEAIAKEFPDRTIGIYAYGPMTRPPVREQVHPNLAVFFCATFDPAHSIAQPISESRRQMKEWLSQWAALTDRIYLYEYDPIPYVYAIQCPLFEANAKAMQVYRELGIKGISFESYKAWASTFPNYYFNAQMMWNCEQDPDALLHDLCRRFFGNAAEPMYRYYRSLASSWAQNPTSPGWGDDNLWKMFQPALVETLRQCVKESEGADLRPMERKRVQMVRYAFDFLDNYLAAMPMSLEAQAETAVPGLPVAVGFDHDRALAAGQRCMALFDEELATDADFVLAAPARKRFNRRLLAIKQLWPFSSQFRAANEWVALPIDWRIKLDPARAGVGEQWFAPEYDDSGWETAPTVSQWYKQGGVRGTWRNLYAWGRARFVVPQEWAGRPVRIFVGATDEDGWFYLNGTLVYHHPERPEADSWAAPCEFDVTQYIRPGLENCLAVLCGSAGSLGGVWRPVFAYTPRR